MIHCELGTWLASCPYCHWERAGGSETDVRAHHLKHACAGTRKAARAAAAS